jgi:hypothetical protein
VYRTTPEAKARRALIASLEGTRLEKNGAYERARAALALDLPALGSDSTDCESAVEARLAEASAQLLTYIRSFKERVDQLDLPTTDVAATIRELEENSRQEEDGALRSLVEEYQSRHVTLQTSVLYDGRGPSWDRLCWRVSNNGHLNLASARGSIVYNGRRLPIETARLLWKIPGDTLLLDFQARDPTKGTVYGLEAGGTANGCFFAADRRDLMEHRELLESQDLASILNPRSGEWSFVFDTLSVTRAPRAETTDRETSASYHFFPPQPLEAVFAPELMARRQTFRARAFLDDIEKSPAGIDWERARQASLACRTVVEMKSELGRLDEKLAGLRDWAGADSAMQGRVAVMLEEMGGAEQDPTDAEETLASVIAEHHAADKTTGSDGKFDFADLQPDTYTILARQEAEGLGWIEVLPISRPVVVELQRNNALHASPAKALARLD